MPHEVPAHVRHTAVSAQLLLSATTHMHTWLLTPMLGRHDPKTQIRDGPKPRDESFVDGLRAAVTKQL